MRLALGILIGSLVLMGCGAKPGTTQSQEFEVLADFVLDGRAELELNNKFYDPFSNCIQLVKRSGKLGIEFSFGNCTPTPTPQITLPTDGAAIYFNGKVVGAWDIKSGAHRIYELCSGPRGYVSLCHFVVTGGALTEVTPGP